MFIMHQSMYCVTRKIHSRAVNIQERSNGFVLGLIWKV